jgi:hypothetical protein
MPTSTRKTPQDRKPKASTDFTFEGGDGKYYPLPAPSSAAARIPGRLLRDAIMAGDDDMAQARLSFAALEASQPEAASLDALYDLPVPEMLAVVNRWFGQARMDGESLPSS